MKKPEQMLPAVLLVLSGVGAAQGVADTVAVLSLDQLHFQSLFGDKVAVSGDVLAVSAMAFQPEGLVAFYRRGELGWQLEQIMEPGPCTTARTGSLMQSYGLIERTGDHHEMASGDPKAAPRVAVLDSDLTASMPRQRSSS